MSRIDELIAELCPDGVAHRPLGELGEFIRGRRFTKGDYVDFGLGSMHYGEIYTDYGVVAESVNRFVRPDLAGRLRLAREGDLVIAATGENVKDVGKAVAWVGTEEIAVHDDCYIFRHRFDPRFISHFFRSHSFNEQKIRFVSESKLARISGANLAKIVAPLPPLEVQRAIVKVLDAFTEFDAELSAELQIRKRQRLALARVLPDSARVRSLSTDGAKLVRIGEVAAQYVEPLRVRPEETYVNLGVKWFGEGAFARPPKSGAVIKGSTLYRVRSGQFIYNRMFAIEGSFGIITPDLSSGVVSNEFPAYDLDHSRILPGWLMLYLQDEYTLKRITAETTGVERGSMKSRRRWKEQQFEGFKIMLPPIEAQREILRAHATGVELELALREERDGRRRQYAYYLDKMLTFDEAV